MMTRSCSRATAHSARTLAGLASRPVGLSGSVRTTAPIRRPACRAAATARASPAAPHTPPSPGGAGTKCGRTPIMAAWAA